jgi:hypothetical protein
MKNVFAEYPLRHSMDLVELGAISMDLVDLEFLELGVWQEKNGVGLFLWIWSCVELSQTRPKSLTAPLTGFYTGCTHLGLPGPL